MNLKQLWMFRFDPLQFCSRRHTLTSLMPALCPIRIAAGLAVTSGLQMRTTLSLLPVARTFTFLTTLEPEQHL